MSNLNSQFNENTTSVNRHSAATECLINAYSCLAAPNTSDGYPYDLLEQHLVFDQEAAYREWEESFTYLLGHIESL